MKTTIKAGDAVSFPCDGQDTFGRILKNSAARFRVLAAYGTKADLVCAKSGGVYRVGCRVDGVEIDSLEASSLPPAPARKTPGATLAALGVDTSAAAFERSHAGYLHALSRA